MWRTLNQPAYTLLFFINVNKKEVRIAGWQTEPYVHSLYWGLLDPSCLEQEFASLLRALVEGLHLLRIMESGHKYSSSTPIIRESENSKQVYAMYIKQERKGRKLWNQPIKYFSPGFWGLIKRGRWAWLHECHAGYYRRQLKKRDVFIVGLHTVQLYVF